jgi:hypothetical protein
MQALKLVLIGILSTMLMMGATVGNSIAADAKAPAPHKKKAAVKKAHVVIQVSDGDPKTWNQALNVIKNIQKAYGKGRSDVRLVVFGNGIGMLKLDSVVANRITDTVKSGAHVLACQNTMRGRKLTKADMLDAIGYVPAGVIEIITRQQQGWSVIRP